MTEIERNSDAVRIVKKSYLRAIVDSIAIVVLGIIISDWINFIQFSQKIILYIQTCFSIPAMAALGVVRDWKILTWGGKSKAELLNQKLYEILSTIGFLLLVIGLNLKVCHGSQ